jgi:hypothetical protein
MMMVIAAAPVLAQQPPAFDDPQQAAADPDFAIQGEYVGQFEADGQERRLALQVVAMGGGQFKALGFAGGLPGDGWDNVEPVAAEGSLTDGAVTFKSDTHQAVVRDGTAAISEIGGPVFCTLMRVTRRSPTENAPPPPGAVVLFDGKDARNWINGKLTPDGLLMQGTTSTQTFGDHTLHIEFRLPYMPAARGQQRGNSGVYLQGRYEVQMLDSFGLEGRDNECGGLYKIAAPMLNMCFPPLAWQTYDIDFTAARFDDSGKKTADARITVRHNGVLIHRDVALPAPTTAAPNKVENSKPGSVYLQNHGNPVRYRNIWVVTK